MKPQSHGTDLEFAFTPKVTGRRIETRGWREVMPQKVRGEVCRVAIRRGFMVAFGKRELHARYCPAQDPNNRIREALDLVPWGGWR